MKGLVSFHRVVFDFHNADNKLFVNDSLQVRKLNDQLIGTGGTLSSGAATDLDLF